MNLYTRCTRVLFTDSLITVVFVSSGIDLLLLCIPNVQPHSKMYIALRHVGTVKIPYLQMISYLITYVRSTMT